MQETKTIERTKEKTMEVLYSVIPCRKTDLWVFPLDRYLQWPEARLLMAIFGNKARESRREVVFSMPKGIAKL